MLRMRQGGPVERRVWVALGSLLSILAATGAGQETPAPKLRIVILEGEGAINNMRQRTAREPLIQVQDENDRPVAGAVVMFTLPDRGASGVFANSQTSMTVVTDASGRAAGTGLRPNQVSGDFQIRVSASHQGQTASATISQTNSQTGAVTARGGGSGKTIGIALAVAGAAAGGAVAALRGSGKSSPGAPSPGPTATTVTLGTPTVSPPR